VIDSFFCADVATELRNTVDSIESFPVSYNTVAQSKSQLSDIQGAVPNLYAVYKALMSQEFHQFLEALSGFSCLEGDSRFAGAGLHRYYPGDFAEIHLDGNRNSFDTSLKRRVNLIVFLNPGWQGNWGGELVLWSSKHGHPDKPQCFLAPVFNRAVIFSASKRAWHSVANVRCPLDVARNSLVVYYFNRQHMQDDEEQERANVWHTTDGLLRELLFDLTNLAVPRLIPVARYLRRLKAKR